MKKTLLVIGAITILSTTAYSWGGFGSGCSNRMGRNSGYHMNGGMMNNGMMSGMGRSNGYHMDNRGYNNLSPEQQQQYLDMREKNSKIYNEYSIEIQQNRLNVERELLNEKPDWKKIEKLNGDIAELEAKARTEMMKNSY